MTIMVIVMVAIIIYSRHFARKRKIILSSMQIYKYSYSRCRPQIYFKNNHKNNNNIATMNIKITAIMNIAIVAIMPTKLFLL